MRMTPAQREAKARQAASLLTMREPCPSCGGVEQSRCWSTWNGRRASVVREWICTQCNRSRRSYN